MKGKWQNQLHSEWTSNPRLRLGVLLIVALVAVYEISGLGLVRQRMAADYSAKLSELSRVRDISKEDAWDQRALAAKRLRDALQAGVPTADTVGLGQATFQGFLRSVAAGAGPRLNIAMDTPVKVVGMDGYWKFPAQISGPVPVDRALDLVRQVESHKDLVTVQAIQLSTGTNPYMNLTLAAYYRVNGAGEVNATP